MAQRTKFTDSRRNKFIIDGLQELLIKGDITKDTSPWSIHTKYFFTYYYRSGINCGAIPYRMFLDGYLKWNPKSIDKEEELMKRDGINHKEYEGTIIY